MFIRILEGRIKSEYYKLISLFFFLNIASPYENVLPRICYPDVLVKAKRIKRLRDNF